MEYSYSIKPAKRTVVDIPATSRLLKELRNKNGYSVKQLQEIFGFATPQAIYKWQRGVALPTIDNLVVLAQVFGVTMDEIIATQFEDSVRKSA